MHFNYLFGPVASRRLGMSLGIDMVPAKTCSMDCIYCECGGTTNLSSERKEYVPAQSIINELDEYFSSRPHVDTITFAGTGEPTLNTALEQVINHIKTTYPHYKTAILTNSSFLHLPEVRESLLKIDYVLPSLDAVSDEVFKKINRPASQISAQSIINGLTAFSKEYTGTLWVEVFIVPGINDTPQELALFKKVLSEIKLARIQINTLDRPGTSDWVKPASAERLAEIASFLLPLPVEIISRAMAQHTGIAQKHKNTQDILPLLRRRPMTIEDLAVSCGRNINEMRTILEELQKKNSISIRSVGGKDFYTIQVNG